VKHGGPEDDAAADQDRSSGAEDRFGVSSGGEQVDGRDGEQELAQEVKSPPRLIRQLATNE
jgi:hypothetical protein